VTCVWQPINENIDERIFKNKTLKVPTVTEWLKSQLRPGDRVGADPKLVSADQWTEWRRELGNRFISLLETKSS
jgi:hypothetical protein